MSADGSNDTDPPRRGRPRKWASEAERKRAYRARKVSELAEPERLRNELCDARSDIRRLEKERARLQGVVRQSERQVAKETVVRAELERRDGSIAFWQQRAGIAERRL